MLLHECLEPRPVGRLNFFSIRSLWFLEMVIAANALSVFLESGFNLFLCGNPTGYQLLGG